MSPTIVVCLRTLCGCECLVKVEADAKEVVRPLRTSKCLPAGARCPSEVMSDLRLFRRTRDQAIVAGTVFVVFEEVP